MKKVHFGRMKNRPKNGQKPFRSCEKIAKNGQKAFWSCEKLALNGQK